MQNPTDFNHIMLWAAFLLCFFWPFLCSGKVTIQDASSYDPQVHLNFEDITANDPNEPVMLQIGIEASKTDTFRQGVNMYIGKTANSLCPVSALLNYLVIPGNYFSWATISFPGWNLPNKSPLYTGF